MSGSGLGMALDIDVARTRISYLGQPRVFNLGAADASETTIAVFCDF